MSETRRIIEGMSVLEKARFRKLTEGGMVEAVAARMVIMRSAAQGRRATVRRACECDRPAPSLAKCLNCGGRVG